MAANWLSKFLVYKTNDNFNHLLSLYSQNWMYIRISRAWIRSLGSMPKLLVQGSTTHVRHNAWAGLRILMYSLTWTGLAQGQRVESEEKVQQTVPAAAQGEGQQWLTHEWYISKPSSDTNNLCGNCTRHYYFQLLI